MLLSRSSSHSSVTTSKQIRLPEIHVLGLLVSLSLNRRQALREGDPSTLQWNYVKLHSLSSSCLMEFVFVYALVPIHNPKPPPPPTRWPLNSSTCMPRSNYYVKEGLYVGEAPNQHFMPRRWWFLMSHSILKIQANRMKMWRTLNEAVKDI